MPKMNTLPSRRTIRNSIADRFPNQNRKPVKQQQNAYVVAQKLCTAVRMMLAR
jgi:hypothetical protein